MSYLEYLPKLRRPPEYGLGNVNFASENEEPELKNEQRDFNFVRLVRELARGYPVGSVVQVRKLYNSGDFNGAISSAASILNSNPKDTEAMRLLARTLDRIEQYDYAILAWDELAATAPMDEEIATRRIRIRYSSKEYELCIRACKEMLQTSIDDLLAYKMMGKSLLNLDKHEDALDIFNIIGNNWSDDESESTIDRILFSLERYSEFIHE